MRFSPGLLALSAATLVLAQQNPLVLVGGDPTNPNGIYQFIPPVLNNITNGTTITFRFTGAPGNHSVTQSTFLDPCNPLAGGFDSGWVNIPTNNASTSPEWNLTITNATGPIWFFCKQLVPAIHCVSGMVGAINPPQSGNTFSAFQSNAQNFQGQPGVQEGSLVGAEASASAGPGPSGSGVTFYTALASATAQATAIGPGINANPSSGGGSSGAVAVTANLLMAALGVILGGSLCLV
ncbi:hypothetical protein J132_11312 [Termitomyces sp. J132]|nr:hypothetical protein J132_11312 [Termitomyces sp. J132]